MFLTITFNSALDRVLFIDEFQPGTTMRPGKMIESVGGKGFAASVVLQTLGVNNVALGFVAGLTGQQLVARLEQYGIKHDLIWVDGETRISYVLVETQHHRHSHLIAAGLSVSAQAYHELLDRFKSHVSRTSWVIAGGSAAAGVPVSCYRQLTELSQAAGASILIDCFGPTLSEAVPLRPTVLKMNQDEFNQNFDTKVNSLAELIPIAQAAREQTQLPALVITCGAAGILACTQAASYLATVPAQQAVNAAGAGDGVSAALVWRLSLGDSWPEALRWAVATGAAVVLTEGTADCHWEDIKQLLAQAAIRTV